MNFIPYPKIRPFGYRGTEKIAQLPVYVSEKLDGSNVSIHCVGHPDLPKSKELKVASRTRWIDTESKQFAPFIQWVDEHKQQLLDGLEIGEVLWGEFCNNHNVLKYNNKSPFVVFDFSYTDDETHERKFFPPAYYTHKLKFHLRDFIQQTRWEHVLSCSSVADCLADWNTKGAMLGGPIEGIVIKNYQEKSEDGEPLFLKIVNEFYKEGHTKTYVVGDSLEESLCQLVFNEARFRKGVQRLKENGAWTNSVTDIPQILSIIQKDVEEESMEEIKRFLVKKYWTSAKKLLNYKIVQRYKQELGLGTTIKEREALP